MPLSFLQLRAPEEASRAPAKHSANDYGMVTSKVFEAALSTPELSTLVTM